MRNLIISLMLFIFISCSSRTELYEVTDRFVDSLYTTYESYGLQGSKFLTITKDGKYQVMPTGRLINVKILEYVDTKTYIDLMEDLESHYSGNSRVKDVYINGLGTIMIDCRN